MFEGSSPEAVGEFQPRYVRDIFYVAEYPAQTRHLEQSMSMVLLGKD